MRRWLMIVGKIGAYLWGVWLLLLGLGFSSGLVSFGRGGLGAGILLIGFLQLLAVWYFWRRETLPEKPWASAFRYPVPRSRRGGATLVSAMVALGLVVLCLTMMLQTFVQGSRAQRVQTHRTVALAACQEQMESLRARGYGAVPGLGEHNFAVQADPALRGTIHVEPGPVSGSKQVTAVVHWPEGEQVPAGQVTLSTILSARGVGG